MKKNALEVQAKNDEESDYGTLSEDDEMEEVSKPENSLSRKRTKSSNSKHDLKKFKSAKFTKQPTTEELNRLRETENLFNSNFFRLQIEEILKEVSIKSKYTTLFQKWFIDFNNFLDTLEDSPIYKISDQAWLSETDIEIPIIQEPFDVKGFFKFVKCGPATIIGSHAYGCSLGPSLSVDLMIQIPNDALNKNDFLNEKYLRKRALFLCFIAAKLNKSGMTEDLKFKQLSGSNLKHALSFKPVGKVGKHIQIVLHITMEEGYFKLFKFNPSRNNVRKDWRFGGPETTEDNFSAPTPFYNSAILHDLTYNINNSFLRKIINENENIKQGVLLLKIWLKQRQISAFSGYVMSMFVAHLVQTRRINNNMSSYQVIRNVWTALAASEWNKEGISLYSGEAAVHQPAVSEFHSYFPVVFVDRSGYHNICSHVGLEIYDTVRLESQLAVDFLDSQHMNGFLPLFMMPVSFHLKYDHIVRIENTKHLRDVVLNHIDKDTKLDCGADTYLVIQKYLSELIHKGLGKRIKLLTPKCLVEEELSWPIDSKPNNGSHIKPYIFGFKLNPDYAFNSIDKGPPANLAEAEKFREFWGAKSELRRFQDGSISEACVWQTAPTAASKRLIVKQILSYLLDTKLGIHEEFFYIADQFEFILHNQRFQPANFDYGTGEEATAKVSSSFDGLMKSLRSLTEMPLEINTIYGISPVFSYSDPIPPLPYAPLSLKGFTKSEKYRLIRDEVKLTKTKKSERTELFCPLFVPALKVILQLSQSGKWPDDIEALRRIKTAFNIQISEALSNQCQLTTHPWKDHVDVFKDGYVYRLEIAHRKEITLMKEIVDKEGVTKYRDTDESLEIEYKLMHLPRLRIALNGLHHQSKAFGPATCILKRWLRSHMFDTVHFPDICIDMLVGHVFMRPEPFEVPTQPQVAFWRALCMLASTDWNTQMIVLNFNEDLSREEIAEVESNFTTNRTTLPAMFFVTPYEGKKPSVWSKSAPTFQVLARIQMLAAESLRFVESVIFKQLSNNVNIIFKPNMEGFDVLIHLKPDFNPLNYLDINKTPKSNIKKCNLYEKSEDELFPVVDFDPVQIYLNQLRSSYDEFALFFHNSFGGDVIALLWKPSALEFKEFKTSSINGRKPAENNGKVGLIADLDAILDGCLILGDGVVREIENISNLTL